MNHFEYRDGELHAEDVPLARIAAAAEDELVRCPECNAILLRVRGSGG